MPNVAPGQRQSIKATIQHTHGRPACEGFLVGIAGKSTQIAPGVPNDSAAAAAQVIGVDEEFVLFLGGLADLPISVLPGSYNVATKAGSGIFINRTNDALVLASTALNSGALQANYEKFGVLVEVDTTAGRCKINLNLAAKLPGT